MLCLRHGKQPVGMNLKESNRWVKKAQTIPWPEIEKRYAALFTNRKGNVAKPLRLALGACIIQAEYGFSDEETALMIQENPYLQYFCGYPGYDDEKLPFDPSLMVYFRKRLTPEVLGEINEMIVRDAKERQVKEAESKDDDDDSDGQPGTGGNSGSEQRPGVADGLPGQKVGRNADSRPNAKANELPLGEIECDLCLDFGKVVRDIHIGHRSVTSSLGQLGAVDKVSQQPSRYVIMRKTT